MKLQQKIEREKERETDRERGRKKRKGYKDMKKLRGKRGFEKEERGMDR